MPQRAVAGDVLVLTKPLGGQVAVNVQQWSNNPTLWDSKVQHSISRETGKRAFAIASANMARLNRNAAKLMHKYSAHAATDVTGFGLMGHGNNLASNQIEAVSFRFHTLPIIRGMVEVNRKVNFKLTDGYSAETSGGLMVCLSKENAKLFMKDLEELDGTESWIIGDVIEGDRKAFIVESPTIVEV